MDTTKPTGPRGGEVRPTDRLRAAPGRRYEPAETATPGSALSYPRLRRAAAYAVGALVGIALIWAFASGLLDVRAGLLVLAALGGYVIGLSTLYGAWGERAPGRDRRVGLLAAAVAVLAWPVGTFLSYLVSLAVIQDASSSLATRLGGQPFLAWLAPQLSLLDPLSIALPVLVAWRTARRGAR